MKEINLTTRNSK